MGRGHFSVWVVVHVCILNCALCMQNMMWQHIINKDQRCSFASQGCIREWVVWINGKAHISLQWIWPVVFLLPLKTKLDKNIPSHQALFTKRLMVLSHLDNLVLLKRTLLQYGLFVAGVKAVSRALMWTTQPHQDATFQAVSDMLFASKWTLWCVQ